MKIFAYDLREWDELPYFKKFADQYGVTFDYITRDPCPENWDLAKGYDAIDLITTRTDREMIRHMHEIGVKYITTRSIGYDHIDVAYAHSLGMGVGHVTYPPNSVANYTIMLMLMCCRNILHIEDRTRLQDFSLKGKMGRDISGCTVGVVGTGRIGATVLEHLSGFGCRLLAYDICPSREAAQYAQYVSLESLMEQSDIITLHAPATPDNYHMFDDDTFARCRDGVIFINCARGSLVDTQAMIRGLCSGKIGFAALDVLENEFGLYFHDRMNDVIDNPEFAILRSMPNVIISPHTAFYTDEAVSFMVENSIRSLLAMERGEKSPLVV